MTAQSPEISIITPCYNRSDYIEEAVDSALAQTYKNFEIILVDDGSTDVATPAKIAEIAKKDKRIKTHILKKNGGLPAARNAGIKIARGNYILPLDSDDLIAPDFLEKTLRCMKERKADIVYTHVQFFGMKNRILYAKDDTNTNIQKFAFFELDFSVTSLYKKSVWRDVGGYNEEMRYNGEEYDFWMSCFEAGKKFALLDEVLFYYRREEDSLSARPSYWKTRQMHRLLKKNHPNLYRWHNYYGSWRYVKFFLKNMRQTIIRMKLSRREKYIRLFGIYILDKRSK